MTRCAIGNRYRLQSDTSFNTDSIRLVIEATQAPQFPTHVINLGQTASAANQTIHSSVSVANAFSTGGSPTNRFTLDNMVIDFERAADEATVSI